MSGNIKDEMSWDDSDCVTDDDLFFGNDLKDAIAKAEEKLKTLEPGQKFRLEDLEGEVN